MLRAFFPVRVRPPDIVQLLAGLLLTVVVFISVYHSAWWVLITLLVLRLLWTEDPGSLVDAYSPSAGGNARPRRRSRLGEAAVQPRRTWHFAQVQYEYQCPENPRERLIDTETVQVYGKCEGSALLSLRRLYPHREEVRVRSINRHFVEPTLD